VILAGSTIWFEGVKGSYKQDIKKIEKTYLSLIKNAEAIDNTKRLRVEYFKKRFFAEIPIRYSYGTSNFVRQLRLIDAEGIEWKHLEMKSLGQDFSFVLSGSISGHNTIDAQARFHRFYRKLKDHEDMVQMTFSFNKGNAEESGAATPSRDLRRSVKVRGKSRNRVELFFTINGEIELE
jgi:hypothetical protein